MIDYQITFSVSVGVFIAIVAVKGVERIAEYFAWKIHNRRFHNSTQEI